MTNDNLSVLNDAVVAASSSIFGAWSGLPSDLAYVAPPSDDLHYVEPLPVTDRDRLLAKLRSLVSVVCTAVHRWLLTCELSDSQFMARVAAICGKFGFDASYENVYACVHFGWAANQERLRTLRSGFQGLSFSLIPEAACFQRFTTPLLTASVSDVQRRVSSFFCSFRPAPVLAC